jgi:hypothetical protein
MGFWRPPPGRPLQSQKLDPSIRLLEETDPGTGAGGLIRTFFTV